MYALDAHAGTSEPASGFWDHAQPQLDPYFELHECVDDGVLIKGIRVIKVEVLDILDLLWCQPPIE